MAAITNFKDRVVDYVDSIPTAISDDGESIFNAGIADVINRIRTTNKDALYLFATSGSITDSSGLSLSNGDILDISRNSKECSFIPAKIRFRAADENSLYYATERFPVFYLLGGKIYIIPTPTATKTGTVSVVAIGTVTNYSSGISSIANYPSDFYHLPILYTAKEILLQKMIGHDVPSSISLPTIPIAPSLSSVSESLPTFTAPSTVVLPTAPSEGDIDFTDTDKPTFSMPSAIVLPVLDLSSITLSISALSLPTEPTAPTTPVFTYTDASAEGVAQQTITFAGTAPTYTQPVLNLPTIPTISDVDIDTELWMNMEAIYEFLPALTATNAVSFTQGPPVYVAPTAVSQTAFSDYSSGLSQSAPGALSISAVSPVSPESPSIDNTDISSTTISSFGTAPVYTTPVIESLNWTNMDSWITAEDSEMAGARIASIQSKIQQYQSDIQNAVQEFNDANVEYQAEVQQNIEQAKIDAMVAQQDSQLDLQAQIQDYQSKLEKYRNEVQSYQAEVNKEVQEYQANLGSYSAELPITYQAWAKTETDNINIYTVEVQNALNEFNTQMAEYQAQLQVSLKDLDADNEYDRNLLNKYNARLEGYKGDVNNKVQEFVNNTQKDIQLYQAEAGALIQQYTADIQNELNDFNEENVEYQAEVKRDIRQAELDVQRLIAVGQQADTIALQNAAQETVRQIQEYKSGLEKYQVELIQYQTEVTAEVAEWQGSEVTAGIKEFETKRANDLQKHQIDSASIIQKYVQDIQKEYQEFTGDLQKWKIVVDRAIAKYNAEANFEVSKYGQQVQAVLGEYKSNLEAAIKDFEEETTKYRLDLENITQENQQDIAKYQAELGSYSANSQALVQEFNTNLQSKQSEYEWMQKQYEYLAREYAEAFVPFQKENK